MTLLKTLLTIILYWLKGCNYVRPIGNGLVKISPRAKLRNSRIYVYPGASLSIDEDCEIMETLISITAGSCKISGRTIITGADIVIEDGDVSVGSHTRLNCKRIWTRFGGKLEIGDYTNINKDSEIRCDNKIRIGDYNQISYNVRIWDTDTHSILPCEERRKVTEKHFPYFGYESSRPVTAPVIIGNDCWIGERSAILKGTNLGDRCIVGFGTLICNKKIPSDSKVIDKRQLFIARID